MTSGEDPGEGCGRDSQTSEDEYHEPTDSYRVDFDLQTRPVTEAVVSAVATAADTDPLKLQPLWTVLDPDALDRFFDSVTDGRGHGESAVTFEYSAHIVTVKGRGTVIVEPSEDSQS